MAAAARAFPDAPRLAIGTSGRIGGTTDTDVEAMEGYAVLRAAQMAGVPAIEVRVISNEIEQDGSEVVALRGGIRRRSRGDATTRGGGGAMRELTFGYSPCPNDTYAFHALAHGLIDAPFRIRPVLLDIEELNRRAHAGEFDLTKLSVGAFASVGDRYRLLRSGAALGHGVGPLVVARTPMTLAEAVAGKMAIPGTETTAYRLLRLAAGIPPSPIGFGAPGGEPALSVAEASAAAYHRSWKCATTGS